VTYEIETETREPELETPRPDTGEVPEVEVHGNEAVIRITRREGRDPSERRVRLPETTWG